MNGTEDFLFYEAVVPNDGFQMQKGFIVHGYDMIKDMTEIMDSYGFTYKETTDFIEFWTKMLEEKKDYIFYPQDNEIVDMIMPLVTDMLV